MDHKKAQPHVESGSKCKIFVGQMCVWIEGGRWSACFAIVFKISILIHYSSHRVIPLLPRTALISPVPPSPGLLPQTELRSTR